MALALALALVLARWLPVPVPPPVPLPPSRPVVCPTVPDPSSACARSSMTVQYVCLCQCLCLFALQCQCQCTRAPTSMRTLRRPLHAVSPPYLLACLPACLPCLHPTPIHPHPPIIHSRTHALTHAHTQTSHTEQGLQLRHLPHRLQAIAVIAARHRLQASEQSTVDEVDDNRPRQHPARLCSDKKGSTPACSPGPLLIN